jgi:NitT/TauT family transport system ATP-binding protein
VQTRETMQAFLVDLWRNTGTTILAITHDVEEAVFLSQRIYVMSARPGTIRQELVIDLPADRDESVRRSNTFQDYRYAILDLLRQPVAVEA